MLPFKTKSFASGDSTCVVPSSDNQDFDPAWPLRGSTPKREIIVPRLHETSKEGRKLTVERLSSHPPIFRIRNFLTPEECETLRRLAVETGLVDGYVDSDDGLGTGGERKKKKMRIIDKNGDGRLDINELTRMMDEFFETHLLENDIRSMLSLIQLPLDEFGSVSIQDFVRSDTASIRRFFIQLVQEEPSKLSRYSRMAWLNTDALRSQNYVEVLELINRRVALLTELPETIVHGAMELQVVHYEPKMAKKRDKTDKGGGGGHFTAHFDSLASSPDLSCCHITGRRQPCRPCRLATILYNLSDGMKGGGGGETAFPLAGKLPEECTADAVENWRMSSASRETSYCAETGPGLKIKPELGQAILWYNHDISHLASSSSDSEDREEVPFLGELDRSTLHAGCPSWTAYDYESNNHEKQQWDVPGKWIANHWIEASDVPGEDKKRHRNTILQA